MDGYFSSYIRVIDIVLLFFILWGAYKGWRKGFFLEMLSTLVFVTAVILVYYAFSYMFISTNQYVFRVPKAAMFLFYIGAYIAGTIALNYYGKQFQDKIDMSIFDDFDNFAGMIMGAVKYALSLSVLLGLFYAVGLRMPDNVTKDSMIYPMLLNLQDWLVDGAAKVAPSIKEIEQEIKQIMRQK